MADTPTPFGKRLLVLRVAAKLDTREAAARIGVSLSTLWRWETGESVPRFAQYADIADAYGVPVSRLFGGFTAQDIRNSIPK